MSLFNSTMPQQFPLTVRQSRLIEDHNNRLILGAQIALQKARSIPVGLRDAHDLGQIAYWEHYIKALQHSTAVAKQRIGKSTDAESG